MSILKDILINAINSEDYDIEKLSLSFSRSVYSVLKHSKKNQKELAEKLNVSEARISKILRGDENLTIATMVRVAKALNCKIKPIILEDDNFEYETIECPKSKEFDYCKNINLVFNIVSHQKNSCYCDVRNFNIGLN